MVRFSIAALVAGSYSPVSPAWSGGAASQARQTLQYPVDVGAVALDVVVTDRNGNFVTGLEQDDFTVRELGVPQELAFFTADRTPLTVLLLLDSSASVRSNLIPVQKAANRFIDKLPREDFARIGFFHDQVVFGPRFTNDMKEHSAMIKRMQPQRSTHLYDALVEALEMLEPVPDRKALLIFSDGADEGSETSKEEALEAARRGHVAVYSVGLLGWSTRDGMFANEGLLNQIARFTGGRAFFPRKEEEMRKAFDRIRDELHHQYRMGYLPQSDPGEPGRWREIQVTLKGRKDLVVRSRLGYYGEQRQGF
jgi:Ca-activated chloride channel family protein